ncbi:hypothetical protein B0H66DRAFT_542887 [Apodospora peruviana]|uniref:Secondary alcohol dehydrogenase n=1 Tax=Apodospora peruviana TaxID=516989 RepID=A0AAE0IS37_9PEZI|nr:hypothetical protein B0H66DRAFT_542887 [Apodospora peruviana]
MSSDATPISPARFAAALKELSISSLHLKVLELRNSIAHLDYSNEELRPFAFPPLLSSPSSEQPRQQPDPDCVEAIRENEVVIERMQERIRLVRHEVETVRGFSWTEFQSKEEADAAAAAASEATTEEGGRGGVNGVVANGVDGHNSDSVEDEQQLPPPPPQQQQQQRSNPWTDGTFQTGVIRNGQVIMDDGTNTNNGTGVAQSQSQSQSVAASRSTTGTAGSGGTGGSISDEELRRRMEEQLRNLGDDDDDEQGGLHL